jgi:hypothetical protein
MSEKPTAARMEIQTPRAFPEKRTPADVEATEDTLHAELATVADRHNGDLDHATLTRALFDFADTYAEVHGVERGFEVRKPPDAFQHDDEVGVIIVPDADEPLAPVNFHVEEDGRWADAE